MLGLALNAQAAAHLITQLLHGDYSVENDSAIRELIYEGMKGF